MVKIFIGNLSEDTTRDEVEPLFTKYGTVIECAKLKNYAFVHMEGRKSATKAIKELHLHKLNGRPMNVELGREKGSQGPVKIYVGNIEKGSEKELRELFEEYGTVTECVIVRNFAFVRMLNSVEAMDAIQGLDNAVFQGQQIHVQLSRSRRRPCTWPYRLEHAQSCLASQSRPTVAPEEWYYPPPQGRGDFYPPRYPMKRPDPPYRGRMPAYRPLLPPPLRQAAYPDRGYGERAGYKKFRAHPYRMPGYDYMRSSAFPPTPPPSSMIRGRSPIRQTRPRPLPPSSKGYCYECSWQSQVSRPQMYSVPFSRRMSQITQVKSSYWF